MISRSLVLTGMVTCQYLSIYDLLSTHLLISLSLDPLFEDRKTRISEIDEFLVKLIFFFILYIFSHRGFFLIDFTANRVRIFLRRFCTDRFV